MHQTQSSSTITYQRRRPEKSLLYQLVAEHSQTVFAEAEATSDCGGYPQYVKDEVDAYLRCGLLQYGFARFKCTCCDEERLVAYSCKNRGFCPSCIAKRSALTAAHLCDEVLPVAPYRQWTLSLPYELRFWLIRECFLFSAVVKIFVRQIFTWQRRKAKALGYTDVHTGSITFAQRFGSLLQLNPHAHTWIPDGVFVTEDGELCFIPLDPPTDDEIEHLCKRIAKKVGRLCNRNEDEDTIIDDDESVMASVQSEAIQSPMRQANFFDDRPSQSQSRSPMSAQVDGFSLHAGLFVQANDRAKLERLLRYGSRPPFAQKRLSLTPAGKVRLKLRKPYYTGQTCIVLEPKAFLRRLFAIIPPPWWNLTRYHGIFSSHHNHRSKLSTLLPDLSVKHVNNNAGDLNDDERNPACPAPSSIRSYATLLSRIFGEDVACCQSCGGPLRFVACIDERDAINKILNHLGLETGIPKVEPVRSPPQELWL